MPTHTSKPTAAHVAVLQRSSDWVLGLLDAQPRISTGLQLLALGWIQLLLMAAFETPDPIRHVAPVLTPIAFVAIFLGTLTVLLGIVKHIAATARGEQSGCN